MKIIELIQLIIFIALLLVITYFVVLGCALILTDILVPV